MVTLKRLIVCLIIVSLAIVPVSSISVSADTDWDSYFGANDGYFWEGAEGQLTFNTENAFTASMTRVGWGGVWGCMVWKSINVNRGQKYNISFKAKSTNVEKYIYVKISTADNLAKGFWVKLPKGQTVNVSEDFVAEQYANRLTFGLGGECGDREGSDPDAATRYAIFDQQFAPINHSQLATLDCDGDFSVATAIEVSDFSLSEGYGGEPINISDYEFAVSGNNIGLQWKLNESIINKISGGQTFNVYLDGKKVGSGIKTNSFTIKNVDKGFHRVGVSAVLGNKESSMVTKLVGVSAKKAVKIIAKNKSFKKSAKSKKYSCTLKGIDGKALKKAKLSLKVNGKTYTKKTNTKGKATFNLKKLKKKGKFKAIIKFAGNGLYKALSKKVKITVK